MNQPYPVLIVEDNPSTLKRIARIIDEHPDFILTAAVSSCEACRRELKKQPPRVMIVDLDLPDGSGIDLIRDASELAETESMVLTVFGDERHVIDAIKAGATGYLLKDGQPETITKSLLDLIAGGSPMTASIARYVLKNLTQDKQIGSSTDSVTTQEVSKSDNSNEQTQVKSEKTNAQTVETIGLTQDKAYLTKRESEVLNYIARGHTFMEIGNVLHLSHHTIISHVKQIYRKLAVNSRGEAVYAGIQTGIVKLT